jgi:hypothetical protein
MGSVENIDVVQGNGLGRIVAAEKGAILEVLAALNAAHVGGAFCCVSRA